MSLISLVMHSNQAVVIAYSRSLVMHSNQAVFFAYSRLYQFIGDVTVTDSLDLQPLFAEYENDPGNHDLSASYSKLNYTPF